MQWSDVTRAPERRTLWQFGVLCLVVGGALLAWRAAQGIWDVWTFVVAALALVGAIGTANPAAVRPVYSGWMIAAFPIGWVVSRVIVAALFFGMFTPVALIFRLSRRDALRLRRTPSQSFWASKPRTDRVDAYLRQY